MSERSGEPELEVAAREVSSRAHCPYSGFSVGAALRDERGQIHVGCNVENASYGLTCCAERNAIFAMVATGGRQVTSIVVYTPTSTPTAPCGACRQVLREFAKNCRILCICDGSARLDTDLATMLPSCFGPDDLQPATPPLSDTSSSTRSSGRGVGGRGTT